MKKLKYLATAALATLFLAACEPVPLVEQASGGNNLASKQVIQMNEVFEKFTPLSFKAMRIGEMRQRLQKGGYVRASTDTSGGVTRELWRGTIQRNGKNVSATRVRFATCEGSTIVGHSRTTLDDMHRSFANEVVAFVRARPEMVLIDERRTSGGQRLRYLLINADRPDGKRSSATVPAGEITYGLGGVRIFDNGERRVGISINTSCG